MTWLEEVIARAAGVLLGGWLLLAALAVLVGVAYQVGVHVERRRWVQPELFADPHSETVAIPRQRVGEPT